MFPPKELTLGKEMDLKSMIIMRAWANRRASIFIAAQKEELPYRFGSSSHGVLKASDITCKNNCSVG